MKTDKFELQQDFNSPTGSLAKGVIKTREEWKVIFPYIGAGSLEERFDWFKLVEKPEPNIDKILLALEHGKYYFVMFIHGDDWEVAKWDNNMKFFRCTDGSHIRITSMYQIDTNPVKQEFGTATNIIK